LLVLVRLYYSWVENPRGKNVSTNPPSITNPKAAAELGEKIYRERYKDAYEREHPGKFVAINVLTEDSYVGDTPEGVLAQARAAAPTGSFHLIQVGHGGAFRVGYAQSSSMDWIFQ
jgi:hypothetical protein